MSFAAPAIPPRAAPRLRASPALAGLDAKLAGMTVFLSPMNYFRIDAVYITAADMAACATLLAMLLQGRLPRSPFGPATALWLAGVFAIAGGLTLGSVAGGDMRALIVIVGQYAFSLVVLPFILAGRSYRETVALMKILVASIVVVMAFGAYVFHFVPDPDMRLVSGSGRLRSLVERSNECAALGAIAIVLLLNLALLGEMRRRYVVLGLPILLYGIMLTGSNTGLLMALIGVGMTVIWSGSARVKIAAALCAGGAVAAVILAGDAFLPEVFRERVLSAILEGDLRQAGTFEGRAYLIREAAEISRDTLFVGLGADQYRVASDHGAPVHNTYMLLLAEGSLLALFGLVLLLMAGVYLAWAAGIGAGARLQGLVTLTVVVSFATLLNTFPHFYARFWTVPLVIALALSAACLKPRGRAG